MKAPAEQPPFRRIVHVMRRFVPEKWGGTESVVFHLAREFNRLGIESPIYATAMFARAGVETVRGVEVHRFPYVLPWWGLSAEQRHALELKGGNPFSWPLLKALRADKRADLFHAHVQHRLGGSVRHAARRHRIPYAVSIHGGHHTLPQAQTESMLAPTRGKPEWGRAVGLLLGARRTLDDAGAIFCVGEDEYTAMRRERPSQSVHYQPNGVDLPRFREAKAEDFFARFPELRGKHLVLCVSRVDSQKNQVLLVEAFARIKEALPDHHLVLIGAEVVTAYGEKLRAAVAAAGLADRFTWIPGLPPGDPALPGAFRAARCFVLPSVHEPFGIVILEAWAAGLPVIASRVGGIPGFTRDGENILHFPSGNAPALASALRRLTDEPGLARHLAANGSALAEERYDWPAVARRLLELYPRAP
ncbi:MAG: glycosyltransferase family 4 protein [Opitutales bacterium]|nr:glycosyltransferase family 4 protein [Opitutales bacterium]